MTALNGSQESTLANWYTEEQAAEKLNISVRSFQRLIAEGKSKEFAYAPEKRKRPRGEGRKPESVFNPEEVDTLANLSRTRIVPPEFIAAHHASEQEHVSAGDDLPAGLAFALRLMEKFAEIIGKREGPRLLAAGADETEPSPAPASVDPGKLYLTIPEAAQVSGLTATLLRRLAPEIGFRDGGRWKIPRAHLADSANIAKLARSTEAEA